MQGLKTHDVGKKNFLEVLISFPIENADASTVTRHLTHLMA